MKWQKAIIKRLIVDLYAGKGRKSEAGNGWRPRSEGKIQREHIERPREMRRAPLFIQGLEWSNGCEWMSGPSYERWTVGGVCYSRGRYFIYFAVDSVFSSRHPAWFQRTTTDSLFDRSLIYISIRNEDFFAPA